MGWVDLLIYTAFHLDHHAFFALLGYPDNLIDQAGQKCRETMLAELKFVWVHDVARIVQTHPELLEDRQLWKELHRLDFEDGFACALRAALDLFPVGMSAIHLRIETAIHQADRIKPPSQRSTLPGWVYRRVPVLGIRGVRLLELRDYVLGGEHGGGSHGRRAVLSPRRWRQSALALGRIGAGYVQILRVWAWVKITNR
jgi:hypothetical protein